jgi:cell wall-associated NlpC family hydrolase
MHLSLAVRRRAPVAAVAVALCAGLLPIAFAAPAVANPAGPHDPFGKVRRVSAVPGGLKFTGWAIDPDELTANIDVGILVDGRTWTTITRTSIPNATVTTRYEAGPTPGFSITSPINTKPHIVCLVARNIEAGLDTVLRCVPTPLGTTMTSAQIATRSPQGAIDGSGARRASIHFVGWATDPDFYRRKATVVLYVDGSPAATVNTSAYLGARPEGAGPRSAFDIRVPARVGMHIGCIWLVNIGIGNNRFLGCRAHDTRGHAGTDPVEVPKINTQVVTEAKRHIGQRYVWGAEGPRTFDCSGLVMYSYGRAGFITPRVSQDQAKAARLIPATRALPGDLVFWHDNEGDVYHVGIYLSPGRTVAAIDESSGVDYQKIWDTSIVTYGSFTHI